MTRVLVVDDEPANRRLLEVILRPEGYEVHSANDGLEALAVVETLKPDVILLDVRMPGLDGIETCRRLRASEGPSRTPVIFVTAARDRRSRVAGVEAGGDEFLAKPVDELELLARVRSLARVKAFYDLREHQRERLEAELGETRQQLLRVERLATLGTLAAGVGHELNNVALVLALHLDLVEDHLSVLDPESLEALRIASRHVSTHAQHLLGLGNPGRELPVRVDLSAVAARVLELLGSTGRTRSADVQLFRPSGPLWARLDPVRFEQVLINLVINAADACGDGVVEVRLRGEEDTIFCSVRDTGCGIEAEKLDLIFEPYYTTKPPGRGTGLGLPVARNIVAELGGALQVESVVGEGTTFTFEVARSTGNTGEIS